MKKFVIMAMAATSLTTMPMVTNYGTQAEARNPTPGQLRGEGRRECAAIPTGWLGIVRGVQYQGSHTNDRFSIRYCFRSSGECARFVNNIERIVHPVDIVTYRNCRPY